MSVMENSCLVAASPAGEPFLFLVLLAFIEKKNDAFCSVALNNLILVFTYFMVLFYEYYFQQVKFTAGL